jgi:HlyD family secretion protein
VKRALLIGAVVVVLVAVVVASLRRGGGEKGTPVDAEAVAEREIRRVVKASGVVDPREKVELSAHVVAKIDRLYVEEGDQVEAGDPVLELERQTFDAAVADWRARLAQARSAVRKAEADLESARLRRQRYERLAGEGVVSDEQVEEAQVAATGAEVALDQAGESVAQARANLAKAEDDLRKTTIYAPIGGRVISLNAEQGEVVVSGTMNNPASVIATLADLSEVLAVVDVDETEIVHVAVGQDAELEVDAMPERSFAGRVVEVGSSGFSRPDQRDVTFFNVKVLFAEPAEALKPGMSVRASIVTAVHASALVVPIQAVVERPPLGDDGEAGTGGEEEEEVQVVFVVADGEARQRQVDTGISDTTHVEITAGLAAGELAVTGPYRVLRKLEDGEAVRVEDDDDEGGDDGGDDETEES